MLKLTLSDRMSDLFLHYDLPVPDAFPRVVRTLANRQRRLYSFCSYLFFFFKRVG
jgi:hypothetical protein